MNGQSAGTKQVTVHNATGYRNGCRCDLCKEGKRQENKSPRFTAYRKNWAEENRDKTRAKHNRWRARNADTERARSREWFEARPAYYDTYRKTERGRGLRAASLAKYRMSLKDVSVSDSALIRAVYAACPLGYEVDHIIPIAKGGKHEPQNLQYLTSAENKRKSARLDYQPDGAIRWRDVLPSTTIPVTGVEPSGSKRTAARSMG